MNQQKLLGFTLKFSEFKRFYLVTKSTFYDFKRVTRFYLVTKSTLSEFKRCY